MVGREQPLLINPSATNTHDNLALKPTVKGHQTSRDPYLIVRRAASWTVIRVPAQHSPGAHTAEEPRRSPRALTEIIARNDAPTFTAFLERLDADAYMLVGAIVVLLPVGQFLAGGPRAIDEAFSATGTDRLVQPTFGIACAK
ncbi:hypothetical protein [Streptomyces sp. NRRL B-24720]|uniref:hypothetical protein n=1 Tax=Streptomyces sp. NRRL B-24720 TaxID=1476876 RepID=UPI0004C80A4A|nr:hypothetical protein [Streptomyces sp. NRRL B-24720]